MGQVVRAAAFQDSDRSDCRQAWAREYGMPALLLRHSLTHSLSHSVTQSLTRSLTD